jgi:ceramide glucosyltransferase
MTVAALVLAALVAGSLVYCMLTVIAARRYLAVPAPPQGAAEPVSVLKPLSGADDGLEENLRSFFRQDYPELEILFAVRSADDATVAVVERLRKEFPGVPARLIVTGEPPYANAKVYSLDVMMAAARHDLLIMSDSDIRVEPGMLRAIAAEFRDPALGLITCPYRAVPGASFWSTLEAIGMNTEFWGGVLVARMLDGMKFAVGPTTAARQRVLADIGGFDRLKEYLAEDFVMGQLAAERGHGVALSRVVVEHRIGSQAFRANVLHRLRWCRSTRRSRPYGYIGQVFTNPLPLALLLTAARPAWWPALAVTALFRTAAAWAVAGWVLHDKLTARRWYLVPLQDLASFFFWLAGFFGNTIQWRGRTYYLHRDGRFERVG